MKIKKVIEVEIADKDIIQETKNGLLGKYMDELTTKEEIKKEIIEDYSYINWLIEFTKDIGIFYDDDFKYKEEELNDIDKENVKKLGMFYDAINDYADQNIVYPFPCGFGNFYQITHNNVGFEIGIIVGQGTAFFCNRTATGPSFIDFEDIIKFAHKNKKTKVRKPKN